jgi:serine/threonine protein kinase
MDSDDTTRQDSGDIPDRGAEERVRDPLELAISEFTEEKRLGKSPTIDDFALRFPALADQIRELFPLIDNLERWKSDKEVECLKRNVPKEFSFDRLGEYQLIRELGRGGMGVVFEAVHVTSQRSVAIKLLPWRYAADMPVWKERLQREASTIAALKHPNIVPIYSFSEDQGYYYYVMQLVDGVGLDKIIQQLHRQWRRRRLSPSEIAAQQASTHSLAYDSWRGFAKIGEQVAVALYYAHKQGVSHNDIKPSNLLVRSNGQVIVTDFGVGQLENSELSEADDRAVGTLRYMAPERWDGKLGPRGDIYALGVTLYELSTQTPVFGDQNRAQLIDHILHHEPQNPRQLNSDFPAPLERIILKAMSKSPENRYSSAHAFARDLRRFINRQPVHAEKQSLLQKAGDWWNYFTRSWQKDAP